MKSDQMGTGHNNPSPRELPLSNQTRFSFQALDMPAQGRGRRNAEDEVDPVGATPVEDLRAARVAVGAQQDLRRRPVGADGPEQPAQESTDFGALRALGGTQHGGDDATLAIEHNDG